MRALARPGDLRHRVMIERRRDLMIADLLVAAVVLLTWDSALTWRSAVHWSSDTLAPVDPSTEGDGAGNFEGGWVTLIPRQAASITPRRGGERVIAERLEGVDAYDIVVRHDVRTRMIRSGDRVVDARDPSRVFGVRMVGDLDGRGRHLLLQCSLGDAEG